MKRDTCKKGSALDYVDLKLHYETLFNSYLPSCNTINPQALP